MGCDHVKMTITWSVAPWHDKRDPVRADGGRPVYARALNLTLKCADCGEDLYFVGVPKVAYPTLDGAVVDAKSLMMTVPVATAAIIANAPDMARLYGVPAEWRAGRHAPPEFKPGMVEATALKPAEIVFRCAGKETVFTVDRVGDAICAMMSAWADADADSMALVSIEHADMLKRLGVNPEDLAAAIHGERRNVN